MLSYEVQHAAQSWRLRSIRYQLSALRNQQRSGQIIRRSILANHACLYKQRRNLASWHSWRYKQQAATAINANGWVAVFWQVMALADLAFTLFLYKNGTHERSESTLGGVSSYGYGINDSGEIVGVSNPSGSAILTRSSTRTWSTIGTLGGTDSSADSVNASGLVLAILYLPEVNRQQQPQHPFETHTDH